MFLTLCYPPPNRTSINRNPNTNGIISGIESSARFLTASDGFSHATVRSVRAPVSPSTPRQANPQQRATLTPRTPVCGAEADAILSSSRSCQTSYRIDQIGVCHSKARLQLSSQLFLDSLNCFLRCSATSGATQLCAPVRLTAR